MCGSRDWERRKHGESVLRRNVRRRCIRSEPEFNALVLFEFGANSLPFHIINGQKAVASSTTAHIHIYLGGIFHIYYYFSKIRFILILINKNKKIGRWDPLVWAVDYVSALISSTPTRVPSYLQKPSYPFSLSDYFLLKKNYLPRRNE